MPNWCNNNLTLTFPTKEEADELFQHMKKEADDDNWSFFGFFVPEVWDQDSWYWSRVDAWGTKWDACDVEVDEHEDKVVLSFLTAYSPPIPFYERMRKEHGWSIQASYEEGGMDFAGKYDNGKNTTIEFSDVAAYCELFQTDEHPEMQGFAVVKEDGQIYYDDQFVGVLISKYQWLPCGEETMNACVLQDNGRSVALSEWELEDLGVM